jgi:hypothetical protein
LIGLVCKNYRIWIGTAPQLIGCARIELHVMGVARFIQQVVEPVAVDV